MPVDVQLSEDRTHLIYSFTEPLDMAEIFEAYKQEKEYRDSVPHTVHSIVDMSQIRRIPPKWLAAKAGPGFTHPRSGEILIVGVSRSLEIILRTIVQIVRYTRVKFFRTRQEADDYIAELILRDARTRGNAEAEKQ